MKNWKIILCGIALVSATIQSCNKDALDVAPLDRLSSEGFWKTEADVQAGLAACYAFLKDGSGGGVSLYYPTSWDGLSDDGYNQYPWDSDATAITNSGPTATSGGFVPDTYRVSYRAIAALNTFLVKVEDITMADADRQRYVGEASFLRAYFYFQLAYLYGDVVLMTEPAGESFKEPRPKSTRDEVLALVNADLDKAIGGLPDVTYTDGHVVKGSAQAFKGRVLLYQKKYAEAAAMSKAVIDGAKFSLWSNYSEIFYKPAQINNPEILFSIKNQPPNSFPGTGIDLWIGAWQSIQPTADLVNEYETIDGSPVDPDAPYENRDPRLRMTVFVTGDDVDDGWVNYDNKLSFQGGASPNTTGFALKKMLDPAQVNPGYSTQSSQDLVLIRYAEVLLNYAEAVNEDEGPANAYAAIDEVRDRVDMPALPGGLSKDQMRERIYHERRVELAMEGLRYYDLRRWDMAVDKLNGFVVVPGNTNLAKKFYKPLFDKWPIPQGDVDQGVKQHDGY